MAFVPTPPELGNQDQDITRAWNAVSAVALARRGLALARDHAGKPLRPDMLAGLEAELEGALHLAGFVAELARRKEAGKASAGQEKLLRLMSPIAGLIIAGQAAEILSKVTESLGGAGSVPDTGLAALLRDAEALRIREDTADTLSLDVLRVLGDIGGMAVLKRENGFLLQGVREPDLVRISVLVEQGVEKAEAWLERARAAGAVEMEAGARRFAMMLGRAVELALLARHAQWSLEHEQDGRALAAARRFAAQGVNMLVEKDAVDSRRLACDEQ